jgi:hypothetical protein
MDSIVQGKFLKKLDIQDKLVKIKKGSFIFFPILLWRGEI